MEIYVDGWRSTDENWLYAHRIPSSNLPDLSPEECEVAAQLGLSSEDYARSKLSGDRTRRELEQRAGTVGSLVESWMQLHGVAGDVKAVWFKTFDGKFRVEVEDFGRIFRCLLDEDVIDGILDSGSLEARDRLDRVLEANFGTTAVARAS